MFQVQLLVNEISRLRKFALRLTKNTADADDLLQATFLRAMEKKEYFEEGTNLFSWSSKIMFNLFVSTYRQKRKFETQYDPSNHLDQISEEPSQEAHVDIKTVSQHMNKLSSEHREILTMICVQGLKYEDAASSLDIPVGTVRSRLSRARRQLQVNMAGKADVALADTPMRLAA